MAVSASRVVALTRMTSKQCRRWIGRARIDVRRNDVDDGDGGGSGDRSCERSDEVMTELGQSCLLYRRTASIHL